ncbi:hypothetical protein HK097_004482 [Rhizophlyctis rosea]|uniref:ABC1 atypical kinase-like domain-containing protein n=1 Tax=Rhizophlyctis rosea TaxID=64517 RepID=A0AAD5X3I6_9FUNG|nr:hypothetical protein HK097_004482 [Rhizophlyctis rosea]
MLRTLLSYKPIRRTAFLAGAGATIWGVDNYYCHSALTRNVRTISAGLIILADYKLNFTPGKVDEIDQLHERTAKRILDVCQKNGGLYIKFGQQIASVPVLPAAYARTFKVLYDNAPAVPYPEVEQIFLQEFGKLPSDDYQTFSRQPLASASIAQVHRATLPDGSVVAVKVQKPSIRYQMDMDLWTYRLLLRVYEHLFDLPLVWSADYIETHLRQETDFLHEGRNAERAAKAAKTAPGIGDKVYVPKVYWDLSSKRVLSAEWINGIALNDMEKIDAKGWSRKEIMTTMVDVFADQIFREGFVHGDPHPGNILVRDHPKSLNSRHTKPQLVLLDHGLYVDCRPAFKHEYALFWKALFTQDMETLKRVTESWGIRDVEIFASATLQRPWRKGHAVHVEAPAIGDAFRRQEEIKERVKHFLSNTDIMPKELIFLGRNMNLIRSNNKLYGSPVNRINMMANRAVENLGLTQHFSRLNFSYWMFRGTLFLSALSFYMVRIVQKVRNRVLGKGEGGGFEDLMDKASMKAMEEFGIKIDESVFEG